MPKANAEMIQGFLDGYDPNNPEPSENRSHSYRHGFRAGRNDIRKNAEDAPFYGLTVDEIRRMADEAMEKDAQC